MKTPQVPALPGMTPLGIKEQDAKIKVEFITMNDSVFARGEYKTMKAMRRAKDRYDLQYGAILRTKMVA